MTVSLGMGRVKQMEMFLHFANKSCPKILATHFLGALDDVQCVPLMTGRLSKCTSHAHFERFSKRSYTVL